MKYTPDNDGECNTACKCKHFLGSQGKRVGCRHDSVAACAIKMKTFPMTQRKPLPFLFMLHHWCGDNVLDAKGELPYNPSSNKQFLNNLINFNFERIYYARKSQ